MLLACLLTAGCAEVDVPSIATCPVDVELSASEAPAGTEIVATGTPFTTVNDSNVRVGGVEANILDVSRDNCAVCDECRITTCTSCYACTDCELSCESCVETLTFVVPAAEPGEVSFLLSNAYGSSAPLSFVVSANGDTDIGDSGDTDSDIPDTDVDTDIGDTDDTDAFNSFFSEPECLGV